MDADDSDPDGLFRVRRADIDGGNFDRGRVSENGIGFVW